MSNVMNPRTIVSRRRALGLLGAAGAALTGACGGDLTITVVNANSACAPVSGASVEIWQCDVGGEYSQYGSSRTQTFLRGIQTTNTSGQVTFVTVYPGWYQGRPHTSTSR